MDTSACVVEDVIFDRVYMIYNVKTPRIYIGSTIQTLQKRWFNHMGYMKRKNSKLYNFMREIGVENFKMKSIDYKIVENEAELKLLEQYHVNKYNRDILLNDKNVINPDERRRDYDKNHHIINRDNINRKRRERYHRKRNRSTDNSVFEELLDEVISETSSLELSRLNEE